ncbi:MAG: DUF2723 domain-containing protein [Polyangiales bacterium]
MDAASRSDDRRAFALGAGFAMAAFTLGAACTVTDRDAGELSSAAFLLDVAHPTGFPLDLALVRLAMLLPFGDVAFRAGLGVASLMSLACGFASVLAARSATGLSPLARAAVALTPAVALAGSSTVLRAATAMEVYSRLPRPLPRGPRERDVDVVRRRARANGRAARGRLGRDAHHRAPRGVGRPRGERVAAGA